MVVDTTNFTDKLDVYWGTTENVNLIERLTLLDTGNIRYEFTLDDPAAFTGPLTVQYPLKPFEGPLYEYACHEGNHGLRDILEISQNLEKAEAEAVR